MPNLPLVPKSGGTGAEASFEEVGVTTSDNSRLIPQSRTWGSRELSGVRRTKEGLILTPGVMESHGGGRLCGPQTHFHGLGLLGLLGLSPGPPHESPAEEKWWGAPPAWALLYRLVHSLPLADRLGAPLRPGSIWGQLGLPGTGDKPAEATAVGGVAAAFHGNPARAGDVGCFGPLRKTKRGEGQSRGGDPNSAPDGRPVKPPHGRTFSPSTTSNSTVSPSPTLRRNLRGLFLLIAV